MHLAFRAGIPEHDFWSMTAFNVCRAFKASQENLSRLAYRTAYFHRVQHKHFPKTEDAIFDTTVKQRKQKPVQSMAEQLRMAKAITLVMGGTVH